MEVTVDTAQQAQVPPSAAVMAANKEEESNAHPESMESKANSKDNEATDETKNANATVDMTATATTGTSTKDATTEDKNAANRQSSTRPTAAKKLRTKHMKPDVLAARKKIQMCCATNDLATALEIYRGALANETRIEAQSFYNLLNLCDGLDRSRIHIGTPKWITTTGNTSETTATKTTENDSSEATSKTQTDGENATTNNTTIRPVDLETRQQAAFEIKEQMDRQSIPLNEAAYTALVKLLSKAKHVDKAEAILTEAEGVQQCRVRLRLYSSLLLAYCQMGMLAKALNLWERLAKRDLVLSEREYAALMECCANQKENSPRSSDAAVVMQKVFTDLSEDVLVPAKDTCQAIVQWFESPLAAQQQKKTSEGQATTDSMVDQTTEEAAASEKNKEPKSEIQEILSKIALTSSQNANVTDPIGPVHFEYSGTQEQQSPPPKWQISPGCRINTQSGTLQDGCLQGKTLQPVKLSAVAWQKMKEMNETIVVSGKLDKDTSQFQGGKKGRKRKLGDRDQEERKRLWQGFQDFLDKERKQRQQQQQKEGHENPPDTIFDVVMDGANIGYFQANFKGAPKHVDYHQIDSVVQHFLKLGKKVLLVMHNRHFAPALMPKQFRPVVQSWERAGFLCKTPPGMNDDWFWMHAALVSGPGTLVLTNDEMRDHHFQMLAPRSFLRWKERHQVHFHFGGDQKRRGPGRPVVLTYPEIYSRRIQRIADGYAVPHPKQGDENRFLDGEHFAKDDAPAEETYLCIRPALQPSS